MLKDTPSLSSFFSGAARILLVPGSLTIEDSDVFELTMNPREGPGVMPEPQPDVYRVGANDRVVFAGRFRFVRNLLRTEFYVANALFPSEDNLVFQDNSFGESDRLAFSGCLWNRTLNLARLANAGAYIAFGQSTFMGDIDAPDGAMIHRLGLYNSHIAGSLTLMNCTVGNVFFDNSEIDTHLLLQNVQFTGNVFFQQTTSRGVTSFRSSQFGLGADLQSFAAGRGLDLAHVRSSVPILLKPWAQLATSVDQPYWRMVGTPPHAERASHALVDQVAAMRFLESNARQAGYKDDALQIFRVRRRLESIQRGKSGRLVDMAADFASGFGTEPAKVVRGAFLWIILFAVAYLPFAPHPSGLKPPTTLQTKLLGAVLFSTHVFSRVGLGTWVAENSVAEWRIPVPKKIGPRWNQWMLRWHPIRLWLHAVSTTQGLIGWLWLALLAATVARTWID